VAPIGSGRIREGPESRVRANHCATSRSGAEDALRRSYLPSVGRSEAYKSEYIGAPTYYFLKVSGSSRPGEAEKIALDKGKSFSRLPHKPFSGDIDLVIGTTDRVTFHSVSTY
jgi:hypothetical protein